MDRDTRSAKQDAPRTLVESLAGWHVFAKAVAGARNLKGHSGSLVSLEEGDKMVVTYVSVADGQHVCCTCI